MKYQSASATVRGFLTLAIAGISAVLMAQQTDPTTEWVAGHEVIANEVLIKFNAPSAEASRSAIEMAQDVDHSHAIGDGHVFVLHSRTRGTSALVSALRSRKDLAYAEPNYVIHIDSTPNDPQFNNLWGLKNTGQTVNGVTGSAGADISATLAWDVTTGSAANVVAVVDTGIQYTHPDLAANVWTAPVPFSVTIGGVTMTCPAGSHGFNAISNTFDPMDDNNHGTHCSGTIGGVGDNGIGVAGINWTASIMGCKFLNSSGSGSTSGAINAIEFAVQAKQALGSLANVRVLSNSWGGGGFSQALLDEINRANDNGMLFCAAAGNNNSNNDTTAFYPADYVAPNVIAVAATTSTDARASFSNYGPTTVHLGAPGANILSTVIGGYAYFSGTSMATPHVSGAAALVLAANPNLTTGQLKAAILNTVDPIPSMSGLTITGGRLNVNKAVQSVGASPDFEISASPASQTVEQGGGTSYTVTIKPVNGFSGTVTFNALGLPSGAIASFTPTSIAGSGITTMSVTTAASTPTGSYPLTIVGTGPNGQHSASVTLSVTAPPPPPDFGITATPSTQSVVQGSGTSYDVTVTASGGFAGDVALTVEGLPTGASGSFLPATIAGSGSSVLSVATSASTAPGSYQVTIIGTSTTATHSTTVTLVVNQASQADFTISASPTTQSVKRGNAIDFAITIGAVSGFNGSVTLSAVGFSSGSAGSFSPATISGSGTSAFHVTTSNATPTGKMILTVTGTSGSLNHSVTIQVNVHK